MFPAFFPQGGVVFFTVGIAGFHQATAAWKLWNLAELVAREAGRPLLRINLDETRVPFHHSLPRGMQTKRKAKLPAGLTPRKRKVVQNVGLGKQRAGFTHVALICDDVSLQPRLPQILLGNESLFPAATVAALRGGLPPNIRLWRRKSGWVTKPLMQEILKELCTALGELLATHQVVLLLDTAGVHICPMFLRAASRRGVMVQYIPAKLAWLLQPLDTHAFARYKQYLTQEYRAGLMQNGTRATELTARVDAVVKACRKVLQAHAWAYAFEANGFSAQKQREVRQTILEELQWSRVPELPAGLPTFPEFVAIFPARSHIPLTWLLRPYRDDTAEPPAAPLPEPAEPATEEASPNPWFGRLRSSSRLALPPAAPEEPPPLPPPREAPPSAAHPPPPPVLLARPERPPRLFPVGRRLLWAPLPSPP